MTLHEPRLGTVAKHARGFAIGPKSVTVCCFALLLALGATGSSTTPAVEPTPPYRYREVLIPADRLEEFVPGCIPKLREDFDELMRRSRAASIEAAAPMFAAAEFRARFVDQIQLTGQAFLERPSVDRLDSARAASGSDEQSGGPGSEPPSANHVLALEGNFPLQTPRWRSDSGSRAAIWGTEGQRTVVLADPPASTLEFDWSLRGQRRDGSVRFHLEMPPALIHRVELNLPRNWSLRVDHGMVTRRDDVPNQRSVWTIESGVVRNLRLTLQEAADEVNEASGPTYRQHSYYEISPQGIALHSLLTVSSAEDGLAQLSAAVDPGLTVTRVMRHGKSLPWSRSADGESVRIDVPEVAPQDLPGPRDVPIQMEAVGSISWQQRFQLPRIRPASALWTADSLELLVRDPLEVTDLRVEDGLCSQIDPSPAGAPQAERFDVILESPSASVQLQVQNRRISPGAEIGMLLELTDTTIQASVAVRWEPPHGELFEVAARIADGWNVESVDALGVAEDFELEDVELEDVEDKDVEDAPEAPSVLERWEYEGNKLAVRLRQSAHRGHPVILQVKLRRELSLLDSPTPVDQFIPLAVSSDTEVPLWMAIHADPAFQLQIKKIGGGSWKPEAQLPRWLRERWVLGETTTLLRVDDSSREVMLGVRRALAPLQVATHTEARLDETTLRERIRLEVDPLGNQLSRLEVSFSQPLPNDPPWLLNGNPDSVVVRKLPQAGQASGWERNRYELLLSRPRDQPFELQAEFGFFAGSQWKVPLVAVRNANTQSGTIGVHGENGLAVEIVDVDGLQPMPLAALESGRSNERDLRAAFRYTDSSGSLPRLVVRRTADTLHGPCWAWRCDLRSYYAEQGRPRHRVDYFLQNMGARTIEVQLPLGYDLYAVQIDGATTEPLVTTDDRLSISLPLGQPYPCLTIHYSLPEQSLGAMDGLSPPFPRTEAPIMQQAWHVWLPPGFHVPAAQDGVAREDRWITRLFGRLAAGSRSSRPSFVQSLQRRLFSADKDIQPVVQQFASLLGSPQISDGNRLTQPQVNEGAEGEDSRPVGAPTWGSRLQEIQNAIARTRPQFRLRIDRVELRRLGVLARLPLPRSRRSEPRQIGLDRLRQAGLGLLVEDDRMTLTSAVEVRRRIGQGDLIDGVAAASGAEWIETSRAPSPEQWRRDDSELLWHAPPDALENSLQQAGWTSHRPAVGGASDKLKVYHRDTIVALSSAVFLATVGIGWWLVHYNPRGWFVFVACATVLALLLPQPGATLAMSAAWAGVVGLLLRLIVHPVEQVARLDPPSSISPISSRTSTAVLGCAVLLVALGQIHNRVFAQEYGPGDEAPPGFFTPGFEQPDPAREEANPGKAPEAPPAVYPVYIPSDEQRKPQGSVVYLPKPFYRLLHTQASASTRPDYLVTSGVYRGTWPRPRDPTSLNMTATYRITTFRSNVHVPLHNFGPGASLDIRSVRVNRQRATVQAADDGRLSVALAHPGEYQITLPLLSVVEQRYGQQTLRMRIPPLMQSRLELTLPRDMQSVEVPSALGYTKVDLRGGTVTAELGPTAELFIRVKQAANAQTAEGVDQLIRLELTPTSAALITTFRFPGPPVPLRLKVDPRLRFVPRDDNDTHTSFDWDPENSELTIRAAENQPPPTARFTLPPVSGPLIGRFRVPDMQLANVPVRQRWFAISVAASLRIDIPEATTLVSQNQFFETWKYEEVAPDYIWDDFQNPLTLRVRAAPYPTTWTGDTSFMFRRTGARFLATAELDLGSGPRALQRLRVPRPLNVETITSTSGNLRWHVGDDGNLTLFFLDPARGRIRLTIHGSLRGGVTHEPIDLPLIGVENAAPVQRVVRLFRAPGTELEIVRQRGFARVAEAAVSTNTLDTIPAGDRLVGAWSPSTPQGGNQEATLAVRVSQAEPRVRGRLVTKLGRDADGWSAEVSAQLNTPRGRIDVARFDVPAGLILPDDSEDVRLEVRPGPAAGRRIVVVWLPPSDDKSRSFTLEMRIPVPAQEGVSLPRIQMLDVDTSEHRILLPTRGFVGEEASGEESTYAWSPEGLQALGAEDDSVPEGYVGYRVLQGPYRASLRPVEAVDRQPRVHLLHNTVEWTVTGHFVGLATFDLQPANLPTCLLEIPPQCRLVQVLVDDRRTMARQLDPPADDDPKPFGPRWHMQLGSAPWPQRIQVVYQGHCEVTNNGQLALWGPRLGKRNGEPIPIARAIWSVSAPSIAGFGLPQGVTVADDPRSEDETILRSFGALLDDAQLLVRDSPREDIAAWFGPWARRSRAVLDRLRDPNSTDDDPEQQQIKQLEADYRVRVSRLGMLENLDRLYHVSDEHEPKDLWRESQWHDGSSTGCVIHDVAEDSLPRLSVRYPEFAHRTSRARYFAAAIAAGLAVFVPWWWPVRNGTAWFRRYPHLVGVLVGFAWWCVLSPRWVGILIAVVVFTVWTYGVLRQRRLVLPRHAR